jgi:mono/diheme cytochrome c family protein
MPFRALAFTGLFCFCALCACAVRHHAGTTATLRPVPGADLARGKAIYAQQCEACHGTPQSPGPIGPQLGKEGLHHTYAQIRAIVNDPQPPMPKLYPSVLSAADVRDVSAYVASLR